MFKGIRNFFLRAAVESAIDRAVIENAATEDTDLFTLSLDDRRRLAVAEVFLIAERNEGMVHPAAYGKAILNNAVDGNDIMELGDATTRTVNRRIQRGMLG